MLASLRQKPHRNSTPPRLWLAGFVLPALLLAAALLLLAVAGPAGAQTTTTDYDADDDRLIEIRNLAQLNAIRHDLNGNGDAAHADYIAAFPNRDTNAQTLMGCPAGRACNGYELMANLNFDSDGDDDVDANDHSGVYWNSGSGWAPLGNSANPFTATFHGNGHTIANLFISRSAVNRVGLFGQVSGGAVQNVGLSRVDITGQESVGALSGHTTNSASIADSYAAGQVSGSSDVGGLIGLLNGTITASYAAVQVAGSSANAGGLVGRLWSGAINAGYATGAVSGGTNAGGLAGSITSSAAVTASYAAGAVTGSGSNLGGLVGQNAGTGTVITSYYDRQRSGRSDDAGKGEPKTTSQLQILTGYTGIYLRWNLDVDNDKVPDYLWNFGSSSAYPTLNTPAQRAALIPSAMDYDADDDGLIEISTAAQLNAVRWDLDGDGDPAAADALLYSMAFGGRTHTATAMTGLMGCPVADGCNGYELAASLSLAADYPAWTPIGSDANVYDTVFDGNGYAISGLTVDAAVAGLFARLGGSSVLRNLGIVSPAVRVSGAYGGGLAGRTDAGSAIDASYVSGGAITVAGGTMRVGGLVGYHSGVIRASYATAALTKADPCAACNSIRVGGLAGQIDGGTVIASYAAGANRATGLNSFIGGFVGQSSGATITDSYCDSSVAVAANCSGDATVVAGYTTRQLKRPTGYDGIYRNWNIDLSDPADGVGDDPWDFGTERHYPLLKIDRDGDGRATCREFRGQPCYRAPAPPPYNPAHDHPEIYTNPRHEMSVSCALRTTGTGDEAVSTSTLTFDLGDYTRPITLALSLWDGTHFRSLQSQGINMPELRQEGQTATVEVVTDPAQTRFRIDSEYGLNLVLGYADCRTDDPEE